MSLLGGLGHAPQENFEKLDAQICNSDKLVKGTYYLVYHLKHLCLLNWSHATAKIQNALAAVYMAGLVQRW